MSLTDADLVSDINARLDQMCLRIEKMSVPLKEISMSHTFCMLKPRAVKDKQVARVVDFIEKAGYIIEELQTRQLSLDEAAQLYAEHNAQPFFADLCISVCSGPVVGLQLYHPHTMNAPKDFRLIVGATDPSLAVPGTIRHALGVTRRENAVHASDSLEAARRELALFFAIRYTPWAPQTTAQTVSTAPTTQPTASTAPTTPIKQPTQTAPPLIKQPSKTPKMGYFKRMASNTF